MPQSITFDERQSDPRHDLDSGIGEFVNPAITAAHTNGDFAAGMRNGNIPRVVGDFAIGMRTLPRAATLGDFATGMRTLPRAPRLGDFATGMRTGSAPVVMNAFRSAVNVLPLTPDVLVA